MGRLSKHIGEGEEVEIDGEKFLLKPLGAEYYGDFMEIAKGFSGAKGDNDMEGMFKNFTDKTMKSISRVVIDTLKKSLPDETPEDIDIFAGKFMMILLPAITELNGVSGSNSRAKEKLESLKRIRNRKEDGHTSTSPE